MAVMTYKGTRFRYNPHTISVTRKRMIIDYPLLDGGCFTEQGEGVVVEIRGEGMVGDLLLIKEMATLFEQGGAGELVLMDGERYMAHWVQLSTEQQAKDDGIHYRFVFKT